MANSQKQFKTDSKEIKTEVPNDVMNLILEYEGSVKGNSHGNVSLVSTLFNSIKTQKLACLRTLLIAVLSGKPDEAKAILEKDASLLLEKLEEKDFVTAPSGHRFNLKPYQAAIAVDDFEMAKMFEPFFEDKEEAKRQLEEQCPEGWEAKEEEGWQLIYTQRDKLVSAIRDEKGDITSSYDHKAATASFEASIASIADIADKSMIGMGCGSDCIITVKNGSSVEQELFEFWRLLDAKLNEPIMAGKRPFNPNLLLTTLKIYAEHFEDYFGGDWSNPRALLFVQKVIGYEGIQRFMPVNYVQAYQDQLCNTAEKLRQNQPQGRSTRFQAIHHTLISLDFYPLQPRFSPGFNIALYLDNDVYTRENWDIGDSCWLNFEEIVDQKRLSCRALFTIIKKEEAASRNEQRPHLAP